MDDVLNRAKVLGYDFAAALDTRDTLAHRTELVGNEAASLYPRNVDGDLDRNGYARSMFLDGAAQGLAESWRTELRELVTSAAIRNLT